MAIRLMGDGTSESMVCLAIGSKRDMETYDMTNVQHYTFWLDDLQPGDLIVQAFDYCGQTYRVVIENWTYNDEGGDPMNGTSQPFQNILYDRDNLEPLSQSM